MTLPGHIRYPYSTNIYIRKHTFVVEEVKLCGRQTFPTMWNEAYQVRFECCRIFYFTSYVSVRPLKRGSGSLLNKANFKVKKWKTINETLTFHLDYSIIANTGQLN